ncbi:MAG: polysaccharide deacetylase family protein [Alphaproteobacteria bacterium]|nr:polysaccharide deacetylase family protein [Alphaproteobacteria bacterium]
MTSWSALDEELGAWARAGRTAMLWWRDDDATRPTPALERLLDIRRRHDVPIALAVIPARAEAGLAERLRREQGVVAWQHGWAHMNHAPLGAPKAEIGPHRPAAWILGELARGWLRLDAVFGADGWRKVLVPPHNRIAEAVIDALPAAGYRGLSAGMEPRPKARGRAMVNAHVDIMNWSTRAFAGEAEALGALVAALRTRREGTVDADEPVGYLTHHLAHDEAAWSFTDSVLGRLKAHAAVRFREPDALFA